jgi:anti-sigma28 factor (negative regulator of flagellin synthesis)
MVDPVNFGSLNGVRRAAVESGKNDSPRLAVSGNSSPAGKSLPALLAMARELATQDPPVDLVKIAEIRNAISTGSYKLDSFTTATAMLRFVGNAR